MLTFLTLMSTIATFEVGAEESASRFSLPEPDKVVSTFGMSEKLGPFGLFTKSAVFVRGASEYHIVGGTSLFLGGVGGGWRLNFRQGRVVPFTNLTASAVYILPMCRSGNCSIAVQPFLIGSFCLDLVVFDGERFDVHLVPGVMSMFDFLSWEIFPSPSDKPAIWPVINLGFSR